MKRNDYICLFLSIIINIGIVFALTVFSTDEMVKTDEIKIGLVAVESDASTRFKGEKNVDAKKQNLDADSIEKGDDHTIFFAYGKPFPTCQRVRRLKDSEKILLSDSCKLNCFHTPGHTKGSMCYEFVGKGKRILFTGDFLQAGEEDGSVRMGIRVDPGYSFKEYLSSVKRMMNVESKAVLPGHFRPYLKPAFGLMQAAYRELLVNREKYKN